MANFRIDFTGPWLLVLLIPAIGLVLYSFFKVNKRFRYSRNRIISLILGLIYLTSSVFLAAGTVFRYDRRNDNQVIVLVDRSDSNLETDSLKDEYVKGILNATPPKTEVSVVTFGKNQVLASSFGEKKDRALENYLHSERPDGSCTDLSAALVYAFGLFDDPKFAKLILLTDGTETDGEAEKTLNRLTLEGIRTDVIGMRDMADGKDVMPLEVIFPDKSVRIHTETTVEFKFRCNIRGDVTVKFYDNDRLIQEQKIKAVPGVQSVPFSHQFEEKGLHRLKFAVESPQDAEERNNVLHSFLQIETVNKILILERDGEGEAVRKLLPEDCTADLKNIQNAPTTPAELRNFDQVILANVANADMPEGFSEILYEYVHEAGGSLLTVGGTRRVGGEDVANTYSRQDMKGTGFQEMLPVLAEDYRPPIAVMLVIDVSLSMMNEVPGTGKTYMDVAKENALIGLDALDARDYVGVITFGDSSTVVLPPTPAVQKDKIKRAISSIHYNLEGTVYSGALEKAGIVARTVENVSKRHLILISDGAPGSGDLEYVKKTRENYKAGVTTSVITFGSNIAIPEMEQVAGVGHGNSYVAVDGERLAKALKDEFQSDMITDFRQERFRPKPGTDTSVLVGVKESDIPMLDGFFGVRLKKGVNAALIGTYHQPIYAEWKFGKGKAGSFMCDLGGPWSGDFVKDPTGQKIICNIVEGLFPSSPVRDKGIELEILPENAGFVCNLFGGAKNRSVCISVKDAATGEEVFKVETDSFDGTQSHRFMLPEAGVYEVTAEGFNNTHQRISQNTAYAAVSCIKEYDRSIHLGDQTQKLCKLAELGGGSVIESAASAFDGLNLYTHTMFNPKHILTVIILVALILDVAVRKFKIKWLHEMIRDRKQLQMQSGEKK